jgi:hypothetical protein
MGPPRVIALDPITGDFLVYNRGLTTYSDAEAMRQDIQSALSVIVGEYFIDLRVGTIDIATWYTKNPPLSLIESAIRAKILSRAGVTGVDYVQTELDTEERTLIVRWQATGSAGVLNGEVAF